MIRKKKVCAGWDGNPHEDYIYKNIDGKKYCKSCTYKLQPLKPIKTKSFKVNLKKKEQADADIEFYMTCWYERFGKVEGTEERNFEYFGARICNTQIKPVCECCGQRLFFEPTSVNFHHILEKRNYPELRHVYWNIAILCANCHSTYETMPDLVPYLKELREKTLAKLF